MSARTSRIGEVSIVGNANRRFGEDDHYLHVRVFSGPKTYDLLLTSEEHESGVVRAGRQPEDLPGTPQPWWKFWLVFWAVLLAGAAAFGQNTNEIVEVVGPAPVDVTSELTALLVKLTIQYPWIVGIFSLMGALRMILKPAMTWLHGYVAKTETKADDELLEKVEHSKTFIVLAWVVDTLTSIKLIKP